MMTANAPTYLDELNDPESRPSTRPQLARYDGPVLMTSGDQSPPIFQPVERRHSPGCCRRRSGRRTPEPATSRT